MSPEALKAKRDRYNRSEKGRASRARWAAKNAGYTRPGASAYEASPERQEAKRALRLARSQACYDLVNAWKSGPCQDCARTFPPECIDCDHRPGHERKGGPTVAEMCGQGRIDRITAELEKCDRVCACCHRTRTKNRRQANGGTESL